MRFSKLSEAEAAEMLAAARDPAYRAQPALESAMSPEENLELLWATLAILSPVLETIPDHRPLPVVTRFKL